MVLYLFSHAEKAIQNFYMIHMKKKLGKIIKKTMINDIGKKNKNTLKSLNGLITFPVVFIYKS